jgi:glycosyltransferase involved in cell wall biosynthesis
VEKLAAYWNIPFVVAEHTGPWSAIASRPMIFNQVKAVFKSAAEVWPVSHHLKSEMAESGVDMHNVHVVANPVDSDFFTLRNAPLTDSRTILFLGRLDDFKGGLRTLKAFHQAMPELPDFDLCIAGFGAEAKEISSYIQENKLESRVNFIEQKLSRAEMLGLFHQARMLVFPSLFESFGLVGIEAMSTGLPLVVTNKTGPRDYFDDCAGVQVDPMSIDQIANAMVQIAHHPEKYDATTIRRHVVENFGFGAFAKNAKDRFDSILNS